MFLDADNQLPKEFISKFFKEVQEKDADIATPYLKPYGKKATSNLYFEGFNKIRDLSSRTDKLIMESGACILVRKSYFDRVRGFSETKKIGEDFEFVDKVRKKGAKHIVVPIYIKTSARRLEEKKGGSMLKYWIGLIGVFLILVLGIKVLKKDQKKFEKMYGKTGGK